MPQQKENFFYTTGWSAAMAAAGDSVTANIIIAADAPFLCYRLSGHVRQGAAGAAVLVTTWGGLIQINISNVNRNIINNPMPMDTFVAPGAPPYDLTPPVMFAANSTIIVKFTSDVVTNTYACLTLHGAKVYGT